MPIGDYPTAQRNFKPFSDINLFKKFSKNARKQSIEKYSVLEEAEAIKKVYEKLWGMQSN